MISDNETIARLEVRLASWAALIGTKSQFAPIAPKIVEEIKRDVAAIRARQS